ncbi:MULTISPECIES: SDR family oxidoreductase [unclassified Mesorhizobium]|uniref:SDR family oxidoreductase n=1 Tax=unclassified Mesorhizobium TaxID=325217 RepID=UPI0033384760
MFVDEVLEKFGRIDVLVNNACIIMQRSIDEQTVDDLDRLIAVNLRGPFVMAKYVAPEMRRLGLSDLPGDAAVVPYVLGC